MTRWMTLFGAVAALAAGPVVAQDGGDGGKIRLVVRADDIGASHAVNLACIDSYVDGIARSVEVLVPAPWYPEAVKMLNEHSEYDTGVHLCLTSEWENVKWGPITPSPSLADALGHFYPMTGQRSDFPPNTGFLECGFAMEEVERELRAQIETAVAQLPAVTHLSAHMGTATASPELRALTRKLAEEYNLPIEFPTLKRPERRFGGNEFSAEEKEAQLVELIESLTPGDWLIVEHPGLDTPEMRAIGHKGYWNVAEDRAGVTHAFTSERVKQAIRARGVVLGSYADLLRENEE